jgi:hypothetical protein
MPVSYTVLFSAFVGDSAGRLFVIVTKLNNPDHTLITKHLIYIHFCSVTLSTPIVAVLLPWLI